MTREEVIAKLQANLNRTVVSRLESVTPSVGMLLTDQS